MPTPRVADRPTISQRSPHLAPRAANAPKVVSEERALALGLPGTSNGPPPSPVAVTAISTAATPLDFPALPDEAANLAARPADTVIETLLTAAHIGLALLDRDMSYGYGTLSGNCSTAADRSRREPSTKRGLSRCRN